MPTIDGHMPDGRKASEVIDELRHWSFLPAIPRDAEYVFCPSCGHVGWRVIGTELPCPACPGVLAEPLGAPTA